MEANSMLQNNEEFALAGVAQLVGHYFVSWKGVGSNPVMAHAWVVALVPSCGK